MDHQFDSTRYLKNSNNKTDYMIVIFAANEGEGAGKPHEMTQAQSNHTKKPPISTKTEHIELYDDPMSP